MAEKPPTQAESIVTHHETNFIKGEIQMMQTRFHIGPITASMTLLSVLLMPRLPAQSPNPSTLTVRVVSARNANGVIRVALFQNPEGFPGDATKALCTQPATIDPRTLSAQIVFTEIPQGVYAVMVFHDENGNGKLDKNLVGIPKEGYGASNNPAKKMRAPNFDEAKFSLNLQRPIEIRLIY
jgi:uncharacterized protein (DUF2141 family)